MMAVTWLVLALVCLVVLVLIRPRRKSEDERLVDEIRRDNEEELNGRQ